jgi:hypothetical protein
MDQPTFRSPTDLSTNSRTPPGIPQDKVKKKPGCGMGCLVVAVVIVAISVIIGISSANHGSSSSSSDNKYEAIAQCEARIGNLLKAPSTADYNSDASGSGAGPWKVTGKVDAENSFGAKVRAHVRMHRHSSCRLCHNQG